MLCRTFSLLLNLGMTSMHRLFYPLVLPLLFLLSACNNSGGSPLLPTPGVLGIEIADSDLRPGLRGQLIVSYYEDEMVADVTEDALYGSSNGKVFVPLSEGLIEAVGPGDATVTVSYAKEGGYSRILGELSINVKDEVLGAIVVSAEDDTLYVGGAVPITALASYSDGPKDITHNVVWKSSNHSVATVENGRVYAVSAGVAWLTVELNGVISNELLITVNPDAPVSIAVSGNQGVFAGETRTLVATGTWADGDQAWLNTVADWVPSNDKLTHIEHGKFRGAIAGDVTVTASYLGVVGQLDMEVYSPRLKKIVVDSESGYMRLEERLPVNSTGHYNDNTARDVTLEVSWHSFNHQGDNDRCPGNSGCGVVHFEREGDTVYAVATERGKVKIYATESDQMTSWPQHVEITID